MLPTLRSYFRFYHLCLTHPFARHLDGPRLMKLTWELMAGDVTSVKGDEPTNGQRTFHFLASWGHFLWALKKYFRFKRLALIFVALYSQLCERPCLWRSRTRVCHLPRRFKVADGESNITGWMMFFILMAEPSSSYFLIFLKYAFEGLRKFSQSNFQETWTHHLRACSKPFRTNPNFYYSITKHSSSKS